MFDPNRNGIENTILFGSFSPAAFAVFLNFFCVCCFFVFVLLCFVFGFGFLQIVVAALIGRFRFYLFSQYLQILRASYIVKPV